MDLSMTIYVLALIAVLLVIAFLEWEFVSFKIARIILMALWSILLVTGLNMWLPDKFDTIEYFATAAFIINIVYLFFRKDEQKSKKKRDEAKEIGGELFEIIEDEPKPM